MAVLRWLYFCVLLHLVIVGAVCVCVVLYSLLFGVEFALIGGGFRCYYLVLP